MFGNILHDDIHLTCCQFVFPEAIPTTFKQHHLIQKYTGKKWEDPGYRWGLRERQPSIAQKH